MPQLAFFPWIDLECDRVEVPGHSLLRFELGRLPGPDADSQAMIDAVLSTYRDHRGNPVRTAVILAANDRSLMGDLSELDTDGLFQFAELFAFACLATREFFHDSYFNRDQLRLVIAKFENPQGGVTIQTPRRDGSRWSTVTEVRVPIHVSLGAQVKPDGGLLEALLQSRSRHEWAKVYRSVVLFNLANTDAPDTSIDADLVLGYAAMEQVLGRLKKNEFPAKFAEAWAPSRPVPRSEWRAPPPQVKWKEASLMANWAHSLRVLRGHLAHGHGHDASLPPSAWNPRQHLLLTSFVVPRLVKRVLQGIGLYGATDYDEGDINALEPLLNLEDVFAESGPRADEDSEWRRVLREVNDEELDRFIGKEVEDAERPRGIGGNLENPAQDPREADS